MRELIQITQDEEHIFLKGKVVLTIGNTIFISCLNAHLSELNKTVAEYDFMEVIDTYAVPNPDHLLKLKTLCDEGNLKVRLNVDL